MTDNVTSSLPILVLTRPLAASQALAARYAGRARSVISPVLDIVPCQLDQPLPPNVPILATSRHAFDAIPKPTGPAPIAYCVGDATAQAAQAWGANAYFFGNDVTDLASHVAQLPDRAFVYLRGRHISVNLAQMLGNQNQMVHEIVTYEQRPRPLSPEARAVFQGDVPAIVPLFSPRSAEHVMEADVTLDIHDVLALSPRIADRIAGKLPKAPKIAAQPTLLAMCDLIDTQVVVRSKGIEPAS